MRRLIVLTGAIALFTGCGEEAVLRPSPETQASLNDCMTDAQRDEIRAEIVRNRQVLGLSFVVAPELDFPGFSWPLQRADGFDDPGYHVIENFVDHDSRSGYLLDYVCGGRTKDDHAGTDIDVWPFGLERMDGNDVEVVAARGGTIIGRHDGEYDRNCALNGDDWNYVAVLHDDGKTTIYGHLKSGSLTSKKTHQEVSRGEYLGVAGSSGNSTTVHLHFEVWDEDGNVMDPFHEDEVATGDCNATTSRSLWLPQKPYVDTALLKIMTGNAVPIPDSCNTDSHSDRFFDRGDSVYFSVYFRDLTSSDTASFRVLDPSGAVIWTMSLSSRQITKSYNTEFYWYWDEVIPVDAKWGVWTFEADFDGETFQHTFSVTNLGAVSRELSPEWMPY